MRQQYRQIEEGHLYLLAEQIVYGGRRAAIGHVNDVDLRRQLEQFAGEMRQATNAGGGKIEFAGLRFRKRDEFSHAFGGNVACNDEHLRHGHDQRDRREILAHVVGDLFHRGADGQGARAHDPDGVAVGICFGDRIGAQHAGLSAAIVDQDRLPCELRHPLTDHARDDVVRAAGRERHDQPDRLSREILRGGHGRQQQ